MAIIWVVLFHSTMIIPNSIINSIKQLGYGGVDIFIFASGLGCFYSLNKNSNINEFLKRRFKKLMPTLLCFLAVYIVYKIFNGGIGISAIIGNILCVQTFTFKGNDFNWYISCIWLFYILAPYIYQYTNNIKTKKRAIMYVLFLLLFTIPFFRCNNLIIMITRLPLFFLGMYVGKLSTDKEYKLSKLSVVVSIVLMIIGIIGLKFCYTHYAKYLWSYGLYWYPFILITPGLCILISLICSYIDSKKQGKYVIKLFDCIGQNTFEVYLVHILIFEIIKNMVKNGKLINSNLLWIKCYGVVIICSILLKYFTRLVVYVFYKMYNKLKLKKTLQGI